MTIVVRGGRVIHPATGRDEVRDIGIPGPAETVIDARDCIVTPGWIDLHVHLREPGHGLKETVETGTKAAAAGGFATVCAMANTGQPIDSPPLVHYMKSRPSRVRVLPVAAVTRGLEGKALTEFVALADMGAVAFSDDGKAIVDSSIMRAALELSRAVDRPVIAHCEDPTLTAGTVMNEGATSARTGLPASPPEAEEILIARDLALARRTGGRLHVAHVSTRRGVEMIRAAKREGIRVTAEVTPHHLLLTDESMKSFEGRFKMNPPLRGREDVEALREGLRDGTIDAIASDHAPHTAEEKDQDLMTCPPGVVGLETSAAAVWKLVHEGLLDVKTVIRAWTAGPSRAFGLPIPDGDWTVFDPGAEWTIDPSKFESKGRHTPFEGWKVRGRVKATIVAGRLCYSSTATT